MSIRVTDSGVKSFVLIARFPGSDNPTRRTLGRYIPKANALDSARDKARQWLTLLQQGIDPADEEDRQRAEQQAAAAQFLRRDVRGFHQGQIAERETRQGNRTDHPPRSVAEMGRSAGHRDHRKPCPRFGEG
jgi:hypothetical protein